MTPYEIDRVASAFCEPYSAKVRELLGSLSPEQSAIVTAHVSHGLLCVEAGAGSGKTRVALAIIVTLIAESVLSGSPRRPLAPSFTNISRYELKDRIEALLGGTEGCGLVTFEHLLRSLLRETGLWDDGMWSREQELDWLVAEIGGELCEQLPEMFSWRSLRRSLCQVVDLIVRDQQLMREVAGIVVPAWQRMAKEASSKGSILEDGVGELVRHNAEELAGYLMESENWLVQALVIDEAQDCAHRDHAIPLICARGIPVIALANRNQCVMGFRGGLGDPAPIFEAEGLLVTRMRCLTNFRSHSALVAGQRGMLVAIGERDELPVPRYGAPVGTPPLHSVVGSDGELFDALAYCLGALVTGALDSDELCSLAANMDPGLRDALDTRLCSIDLPVEHGDGLIMVPSNTIGHRTEVALASRGAAAWFAGRPPNPYEGLIAWLAGAWADPAVGLQGMPSATAKLSVLLESLVAFDVSGSCEELEMVVEFLLSFNDKFGIVHESVESLISAAAATAIAEPWMGPLHRLALDKAYAYLATWLHLGGTSLEVRFDRLVAHLPLLASSAPRTCVEDPADSGPASDHPGWPRAFVRLVEENIDPRFVREALKRFALKVSMARKGKPPAKPGFAIRTVHGSKGLTKRVTFGVRAELLSRRRPEVFALGRSTDAVDLTLGRLAYVCASRAEEVHIEFALSLPGRLHRPPGIAGWEYLRTQG